MKEGQRGRANRHTGRGPFNGKQRGTGGAEVSGDNNSGSHAHTSDWRSADEHRDVTQVNVNHGGAGDELCSFTGDGGGRFQGTAQSRNFRNTTRVAAGRITQLTAGHVTKLAAGHVTKLAAGHVTKLAGHVTKLAGYVTELAARHVTKLAGYVTELAARHVTKLAGYVTELAARDVTKLAAGHVTKLTAGQVHGFSVRRG